MSARVSNTRLKGFTLTVANDRIFLAGGSNQNLVSSTVDIFIPHSGSWEQIQLPKARRSLVAASLGSSVLFAGGIDEQNQLYSHVDIYDFRTRQWMTLDFDTRHVISGSIVARSQVFFYTEQDDLVIVTPSLNLTSTLPHTGRFVGSSNNATHLFFLLYRDSIPKIDIFDIDSRTWDSIPASAPFTEINGIFHVSNQLLVLVGSQQAHVMSLRTNFQRTFTFTNSGNDPVNVISVGDELYFFMHDSVTVANMPAASTVRYNMLRSPAMESNVVVHDNVVYFTGPDDTDSRTELFRFEVNQLFQRLNIAPVQGMPTYAASGVLFWISPAIGIIKTFSLRNRRMEQFYTNLRNHDNALAVKVNSKLVIVASDTGRLGESDSNEFDLYDFISRTVTTSRMRFPFAAISGISAQNYALFLTASNFLYVYEEPLNIWFRIFSDQPTHFAAIIEDDVIMVHTNVIETYNLHTMQMTTIVVVRSAYERSASKYLATPTRLLISDVTASGSAIVSYRHRDQLISYYNINYRVESVAEIYGYAMFNAITTTHPQKLFVDVEGENG